MVADDDERTTDVGLYHYAVSYRAAADALRKTDLAVTHPDAPRAFLYYHAIELFVKAFLRHCGRSVQEIRGLSHDARKLRASYKEHGGELGDEDEEVFGLMTPENVIGARYISTGAYRQPALEALARTSQSLNETVRGALRQAGRTVR